MKAKLLLLSFISIILCSLFMQPLPTYACSCMMMPPVEEEFSNSQAVFSGEVIDIRDNRGLLGGSGMQVRFKVKETWKGISESEITILTGSDEASCGFSFTAGQDYLVYAKLSDMYGEKSLSTGLCDRTNELGNAVEDIAILGNGQVPTEVSESSADESNIIYLVTGIIFLSGLLIGIVMRKRKKK